MVFTSPPPMRMACKQLAGFGDNFKDGHKPFHEDCYKQLANFGDKFKDGLHKLTFHEVVVVCVVALVVLVAFGVCVPFGGCFGRRLCWWWRVLWCVVLVVVPFWWRVCAFWWRVCFLVASVRLVFAPFGCVLCCWWRVFLLLEKNGKKREGAGTGQERERSERSDLRGQRGP